MEATVSKKELNWAELGFQYIKTDCRFTAIYQNGEWNDGGLVAEEEMSIHEGAPSLHYAQQCFEGMKAQTAEDGHTFIQTAAQLRAHETHCTSIANASGSG